MIRPKKRKLFVETLGSPVLSRISEPVGAVDDKVRELAALMAESMFKFDGVGIAAPQVGRNLRLVVFGIPEDAAGTPPSAGELELLPRMPLAVINPEIVSASEDTEVGEEGCLSVPDIRGKVERPARVVFRATTLDGETFELECGGLLARCIQHELDHLNGLTFVDRLDASEYARNEVKIKNLRKAGGRNNYRRVL